MTDFSACKLWLTGETPRKTRGSLIGMVNEREFGVSFLEANISDNVEEASSTLQARLDNIPPSVGEWSHITSTGGWNPSFYISSFFH